MATRRREKKEAAPQEEEQPQAKGESKETRPDRRPSIVSDWRLNFAQALLFMLPFLAFAVSSLVRDFVFQYMGYGVFGVALWVAALLLALRFRPGLLVRFWRHWVAGGLLVAAAMGALSFRVGQSGVLQEFSLGGRWGQVLGGEPPVIGGLKVLVMLALVPVVLVPDRTLRLYRRSAVGLGLLSWAVLRNLGLLLWLGLVNLFQYLRKVRIRIPIPRAWRSEEASPALGKAIVESAAAEAVAGTNEGDAVSVAAGQPAGDDVLPEGEQAPDKALPEAPRISGEVPKDEEVTPFPPTPRVAHPQALKGGILKWSLPPMSLLDKPETHHVPEETLQSMAQRIETTLAEHGVETRVETIRPGPRVILFGLVPGWSRKRRGEEKADEGTNGELSRVKVDSIIAREKDLALALKTPHLRLEAPVPGERLVGIEVPNPQPTLVTLSAVMETPAFNKIKEQGALPLALGQGTGGDPVVADLKELPHLLIAGATGSGKSVCINSVISSLILTRPPDRLRLLLVDPKRVELTPFNGIPHLLAPVVVETEEVLRVLDALLAEMFRRYKLMEELKVRNIDGYNHKASSPFPYLVLIIDELADLMMSAANEAEQSLVRLAQLGRATGIHLILATQRPSVNVVTGLLKANVPSRIAFAVASQVDSRVILDGAGAEKLLGKGDMLFLSSNSPRPRRVQGVYVSDREIEELVQFWKKAKGPALPPSLLEEELARREEDEGEVDELLEKAKEIASRSTHLSPSMLQRRLRIGYPRAMRLIELLEEEGILGPGGPGMSREVLVKPNGEPREPS